jgi:hypothetical protein
MDQPHQPTWTVVSSRRPAPRLLGWPLWAWTLLVAAAAAGFAVVAVLSLATALSALSVCGEPRRPAAVERAQWQLLVTAAVALVPWLVAAWLTRRWVRVLVAAAVCVAPAVLGWVSGLDPTTYGPGPCS